MNKSMMLLGSALSFALMFGQNSYATEEETDSIENVEMQYKDRADKKSHKVDKCNKKQDCKGVQKKLKKIIKKIEDSAPIFDQDPAKYFKQVSFNTILLLKAYKCCEKVKGCKVCVPSDMHVETVKLHATMFEAWANASKEEDKIDKALLSNAHDKVPEIIQSAEYLLENCCKKADEDSKEDSDTEKDQKDE